MNKEQRHAIYKEALLRFYAGVSYPDSQKFSYFMCICLMEALKSKKVIKEFGLSFEKIVELLPEFGMLAPKPSQTILVSLDEPWFGHSEEDHVMREMILLFMCEMTK